MVVLHRFYCISLRVSTSGFNVKVKKSIKQHISTLYTGFTVLLVAKWTNQAFFQFALLVSLYRSNKTHKMMKPGRVAQSVTCLATDAKLTADPGVASSIPARSHTFVEIEHEIISTVILLA